MPYITQSERNAVDVGSPMNAGQLNYSITMLIKNYVNINELKYQTINDIIGALEGAKAEFQRRVVAPYEDKKILENGDI